VKARRRHQLEATPADVFQAFGEAATGQWGRDWPARVRAMFVAATTVAVRKDWPLTRCSHAERIVRARARRKVAR